MRVIVYAVFSAFSGSGFIASAWPPSHGSKSDGECAAESLLVSEPRAALRRAQSNNALSPASVSLARC